MARFSTVAVVSLALLGAAGCASREPTESYSQVTSAWLGRSEAALVTAWGVPSKSEHLADGGQVDQYDLINRAGEITCTTIFTADATGRVDKVASTGTECHPPRLGESKS